MAITGLGFKSLITVQDALNKIKSSISIRIKDIEELNLLSSLGRVSAEEIKATIDIPPFDRAAMDGYAALSEDIRGASLNNPVILKVTGKIEVGEISQLTLKTGEVMEISTGAKIPEGADVVIPYEEAKRVDGYIEVYKTLPKWKNISRKGEDLRKGEIVLTKNQVIRAWNIGVLASLNITKIKVYRKPRIGILSTGSELIELGGKIEPGKIINSTKWMLAALTIENGGEFIDLGTAQDDIDEIENKIKNSIEKVDIVITTGGTSVGKKDYTIKAIKKLGAKIIFHGVSIKPGKPTGVAIYNGKPIAMLSGFPVAALVGFETFVKPIIEIVSGIKFMPLPKIRAKMSRRVASTPGVRDFLRVKVIEKNGEYYAEPLKLTGSGILSTVTKANGIIVIPEEVEGLEENEEVEVLLLRALEESN